MDLRAGQTVLDVAAGNGNVTLAAARRGCKVTSTDYVEALLSRGRKRAEADGYKVDFQIADAEDLPFAAASFDAVVSAFGGMFSPDQDRTAAELLRVCKSGGRIGLANWTPDGFIGRCSRRSAIPAAAGGRQVTGGLGHTRLCDDDFRGSSIHHRCRAAPLRLSLPLGTTLPRCLSDLLWTDAQGVRGARPGRPQWARTRHHRSCRALQRSGDQTMVVPGEYLEVVVSKR